MGFINFLKDDDWSAADILRRTEAEINLAGFTPEEERALNRYMWGVEKGIITEPEEVARIQYESARFAEITMQARQNGIQARADMDRLRSAWAVEQLQRDADSETDPDVRASILAQIQDTPPDIMEIVEMRAAARAATEPTSE